MEAKTISLSLAVAGAVLVVQTFLDVAPSGPWDSASFSRGVLGLAGLSFLYLAWYERTFGRFGIAPTVNRWKNPEDTWLSVVVFGLVCLVVTRLLSLFDTGHVAPEPAGLILALFGFLALFNGLYVWSITKGPLALNEEE
ncbi:MAG: hypothetical protein P8Q40_00180 [Candidatus Poseidonia sp.]|jgi:hypothetical protein|uniref:hypothetical protein n=1 Tax=Poseidonia sp. TaxID=2666344 RepID=UPI0030BD770F|nr:hypothetical protein [Poseidonia sp.]MDG1552004.1 hypothetical protein [Poseidonia sp.]